MGATQTGLLERLQARSESITLPPQLTPCHLVKWLRRTGDTVERFEPIAVVEQDQVVTTITATQSGRLRGLSVQQGNMVYPGQPICHIEVIFSHPRPATPSARLSSPKSTAEQMTLVVEDEPSLAGDEAENQTDRRPAILPVVEQIVRERIALRATTVLPTPARKKARTKAKVYRVTPDQVQQVKALTQQVRAHEHAPTGPPISESELIRASIELLSSLSLEAVLAIMAENRERERAGKYGAGWPRPGCHRRRKKRS